ncbi:MAG: YfhO family protein [Lachnospiraceae bacterium]|nr:YfhO family protein [Lachnospiraceae bacterium]
MVLSAKIKSLFYIGANKEEGKGFRWCAGYFLAYSVLFGIVLALTLGYLLMYHKTLIWDHDGIKQHYNALLYYGRFLKDILHGLLSGGGLNIPHWDFSIGYGADILTSLNYYAIGDPLCFLSVLVPESLMDFFYTAIFIIRIYLGGLAFSLFSLNRGRGRFPTLCGALIYAFSAYAFTLGAMHSCFLIPVVYFPLMLYGMDRIFEGRSPLVFILSVAFSGLSNFYFFYMEAVLVFLYGIYSYFSIYGSFKLKEVVREFGRFLFFALTGVMISAVVLLPVLLPVFTSNRLKAAKHVPLLYPLEYYFSFVADFCNMQRPGSWTLLGYTAVGLMAVLLLFSIGKGQRSSKKGTVKVLQADRADIKGLRLLFIAVTLMLFIPAFGFLMTGFAYVVNRWVWGYSVLISYIISRMVEELPKLRKEEKSFSALLCLVTIFISLIIPGTRTAQTFLSGLFCLGLSVCLLLYCPERHSGIRVKATVLTFIILGLAANAWFKYSVNSGDWLSQCFDFRRANENLLEKNADSLFAESGNDGFMRKDESFLPVTVNSAIERGVYRNSFYFSVANPYMSRFVDSLYFDVPYEYQYYGADGRTPLLLATSVSHILSDEENAESISPLYGKKAAEGDTAVGHVAAYEAELALPMGYGFSERMRESVFLKLDAAGRQMALLTAAVLPDNVEAESQLPEAKSIESGAEGILKGLSHKGNVSLSSGKDMDGLALSGTRAIEKDGFRAGQGGRVLLSLNNMGAGECYLIVKNLHFKGINKRSSYDDGAWAGLSPYEKHKVYAEDFLSIAPVESSISIEAGGRQRIIDVLTDENDSYCGRHDFLVNLGYFEAMPEEISLSFRQNGEYSFDSLSVVRQDMGIIEEKARERKENVLTDVKIGTDSVDGKTDFGTEQYLFMSIPYSEGWKAYIDGRETQLYRANVAFMCIKAPSGKHDISLIYETPGLKTGGTISGIGFLLFIGIIIFDIIKRRRAQKVPQ